MLHIHALERLVQELARLPGIGPKSAQRLAYHILKAPADYSRRLGEALERVQREVHDCPQCFNFTDASVCRYCTDPSRSDEILCVVEEPSDIQRIESSGAFRGRYHVLHGSLSPLEGVGPDDLKIEELIQRVNAGLLGEKPRVLEIVLALDADLEGDTTVLYLAKALQGKEIRLSRIAHGVPIGGDIDYVDDRTMSRAMENRVVL
jgi:recombination protein RecR